MRILFATSEAVPFCKTGGLGDVCGALPGALADLGHHVSLVLPGFRSALESGQKIEDLRLELSVPVGNRTLKGKVYKSRLPNTDVPVYLIGQEDYFDRPGIYGEGGEDYVDNCARFVFFSRAVLELLPLLDLRPDVIHCHDWTVGLVPAYLDLEYRYGSTWENIASLFTIHNLAYQGNFWHWDMELTGLPWKHFNWQEMEFHGQLSMLKTGLVFADQLSTVSPTYAQEIQSPPLSCGMEGVLRHRTADLSGIINGVDYSHWDPAVDSFLAPHQYDVNNWEVGKAACKRRLQEELGLPVDANTPMLGIVGRLVDQKGFDLVAKVLQDWVRSSPAQWVILGTGDPRYHKLLSSLAAEYPRKVAARLEFSNEMAHQIEAGADLFLMPSRYEPCGLNQLYSLRYGTVPVVHATGGLADTIVNTDEATLANGTATGFAFDRYTEEAFSQALRRAVLAYADRTVWRQLVTTGMRMDWSWNTSAQSYIDLYRKTVAVGREHTAVGV